MAASKKIVLKKQQLRNNEYYNTQAIQDILYRQSKENYEFQDLISKIIEKGNILVAYRNIKRNAGSKTPGVNNYNIKDVEKYELLKWVSYIRQRFENFYPMPIRRVEIEKDDGRKRPLGIPTIEDRMLQQCIKQILEPIVEAKFYHGSYGFRPDRGAKNAIAKVYQLINFNKLHYAVDIDIKAFFDNVDHGKLMKQIWTMGIRDKKLISIISSMMKAEIEGIGIPQKGVPQGGILSPLLSNIVLNELDWWISSQWETMKTNNYSNTGNKNRALKKSKLKEMYIVRYADDFKVLTRDAKSAQKIFVAVSNWLKERLRLDINKEKSQIINLRKNYSNFLGIKIKAIKKAEGYVARSRISDKADKKIKEKIKNQIEEIKKQCTVKNVSRLNSMILGWHNYYSMATLVNIDFREINFLVRKRLYNRTRSIRSDKLSKSETYKRLYGKYNFKTTTICNITIYPLAGITFRIPKFIKNQASRYTIEGRYFIHKDLASKFKEDIKVLIDNPINNESMEKNDNRISLYVGQKGLCHISKQKLNLSDMVIRNKLPKDKGGTDRYHNLILVNNKISTLIDEIDVQKINQYKEGIELEKKALDRLNALRILVGNPMI
jgi:group II intron reverse transcriptase/maturase